MGIICEKSNNIQVSTDETYNEIRQISIEFTVIGTPDIKEAIQTVRENAPDPYLDTSLTSIDVQEKFSDDHWVIRASYDKSKSSVANEKLPEERVSFSSASSNFHRTHSLQTVHRYGKAPDMGGAIDVQGREILGCDIYQPCPSMKIVKCFKSLSTEFRNRLLYKSCHVNDSRFRGFKKGELLYLNAEISQVGNGKKSYWQVEYTFLVSANQDNMSIAGFDTNVDKEGWQYLWMKYTSKKVTSQGEEFIAKKPVGAYIEKVYYYYDFKLLGLSANG